MKRALKKKSPRQVVAFALAWDGARRPVRSLPPQARAFLAGPLTLTPSARRMAELFAGDGVREIRVCWLPCLQGGPRVMSEPFETPARMKIAFRVVRTISFGDILGVIYRRDARSRN